MKFIIVLGVLTFLFLFLAALGMRKALKPDERQRVAIRQKHSPFQSARAFNDLEQILAIGPRTAGSEGAQQCRDYLKHALAMCGVNVREHRFDADTPLGKRTMVNLVAVVEGTKPGAIVLGNHYDTKHFTDFTFVGANDGGSTTAFMLEAARMFGPRREGHPLWLVWFDGEEAFGKWSDTDGIYGSRAFVEEMKRTGELAQIRAMINFDMIGDRYLGIARDKNAAPWLRSIFWDTGVRLNYGAHFERLPRDIIDDDLPFRKAGVPTLLLIDFSYGGSMVEHQRNWHTANDTIDKVCAESLQAVADVLYHALPAIEGYLDGVGRP
jgi:hypothetical protein